MQSSRAIAVPAGGCSRVEGCRGARVDSIPFLVAESHVIVSRVTLRANWLMDTSSLVALSQSTELLARFEGCGKGADVTLPSAALDELFAGPNADHLLGAAALLVRLSRSFDKRLHVAQPHSELWLAEYREPLLATPLIAPDARRALFRRLEMVVAGPHETVDDFASVRLSVKEWKDERKESSKQIVKRAVSIKGLGSLSPAELKMELETSFGIETVEEQAEKLLRRFCSAGDEWRETWRAPGRLPAMKVQVGLMWLAMLAEVLPKRFGQPDAFFEMLCRNRNDFFDAAVASVAGYCTHFVTEDAALARRCSLLRLRGFLGFEALSLDALMSGC